MKTELPETWKKFNEIYKKKIKPKVSKKAKLILQRNKLDLEIDKLNLKINKLKSEILAEFHKFDKKNKYVITWEDFNFNLKKMRRKI